MKTYTIDATGKKLGRVASEAAIHLIGKNKVEFTRNKASGEAVEIINASKIDVPERKLTQKKYDRYSGYPGGLKSPSMKDVIAKKGFKGIFELAIYGMLPSNKLRPKIMKNLTIKE